MSAITVENRLTCPKGCKPADAAPEEKPTCPSGNGRTITEGGVVFTLKCSTYHALTDLTTAPGNSPAECAKACADNPACQGVDFGRAAKTCYLKSEVIGSTSQVSEAYDALVLSQKRPDTSTPPPAPAPTCPSGNGKTITEGGVVFTLKCSTYHGLVNLAVVPGNSPAECAKACVDNPACQGVDFGRAAKTCSLKSEVIGSTSQASEAYDALVLSQKRPATSAPPPAPAEKPTCPDGNGKTYTANGVEFKLHCDKTITGNEIKRIAATSSGTCLEECAAMPACQGYGEWPQRGAFLFRSYEANSSSLPDYIRFSKACSLKGTYTANPAANTGRECWVPTKQR
ncbi:MAG: hypothetical protein M1833_001909 [Piccolia ochrophora]|nr:MAG: hypothetical protein M1833_001909 [Piccolia ochrophora]